MCISDGVSDYGSIISNDRQHVTNDLSMIRGQGQTEVKALNVDCEPSRIADGQCNLNEI